MKKGEIKPLTGLRGLAALAVFAHHVNLWMPTPIAPSFLFANCNIGVDIFFMLSGFILMYAHENISGQNWKNFYLRRIFRIYPLHIMIMLLLAAKTLLIHPIGEAAIYYDWHAFPAALTLTLPFFGFGAKVWNAPSWSLTVELTCYVLFPIAAILLVKAPRVLICLLLIIALGLEIYVLSAGEIGNFAPAYEGITSFERGTTGFFSGILLFLSIRGRNINIPFLEIGVSMVLICLIMTAYVSFAPILIASLIVLLFFGHGPVSSFLGNKYMHWIGEVSLSFYLLHSALLHIFSHAQPYLTSYMDAPCANGLLALSLLFFTLMLSGITYQFIERPGQRLGKNME